MFRYLYYCFFLILCLLNSNTPAHAYDIQEVTSQKGIKSWLIENRSLPAIYIRISFDRSGNAYSPEGKEGLAQLVARLLLEGAGDYNAQSLQEALDFYAINLGFDVDEDSFYVQLESLSEHREKAFELLREILLHPRFEDASIQRLKEEVTSELRHLESDPKYQASRHFAKQLYGNHPYANAMRGTVSSLQKITRDDIVSFHRRHLVLEGMTFSIAGDISAKQLQNLLNNYLDPLPKHSEPPISLVEKPSIQWGSEKTYFQDIPQSIMRFALPGMERKDERFYDAYVLNYLLGGNGLSSKLAQEIRRKRGLAYYAYSYLENHEQSATLKGSFATQNAKREDAIATLRAAINEAQVKGFDQQTFEDAMAYITGAFPINLSSNRKLVSYLHAMQFYDLGKDYLEKRNDYMRSVSRTDVNQLAKTFLDPEKIVLTTVGGSLSKANTDTIEDQLTIDAPQKEKGILRKMMDYLTIMSKD